MGASWASHGCLMGVSWASHEPRGLGTVPAQAPTTRAAMLYGIEEMKYGIDWVQFGIGWVKSGIHGVQSGTDWMQ